MPPKFYAVKGYSNARFKSFGSLAEAKAFVAGSGSSSGSSSAYYQGSSSGYSSGRSSSPSSSSSSGGYYGGYSSGYRSEESSSGYSSDSSSGDSSEDDYTFRGDGASPWSSSTTTTSSSTSSSGGGSRKRTASSMSPSAPPAKRARTSSSGGGSSSRRSEARQVVYTDGSSIGNGTSSASAGVGVWFGHGDPRNVSEPLPGERQTNQRAEITAVKRALEKVPSSQAVEIRTDSHYVMKAVKEWIPNWRKRGYDNVQNADLFKEVDSLIRRREKPVEMVYVPAHTGEHGNESADRLAKQAAVKKRR